MRTEDCSALYAPQTVFQFNNGVSLRGGRRAGDDVSLFDRTTVTRDVGQERAPLFSVHHTYPFAFPSESSQLWRAGGHGTLFRPAKLAAATGKLSRDRYCATSPPRLRNYLLPPAAEQAKEEIDFATPIGPG